MKRFNYLLFIFIIFCIYIKSSCSKISSNINYINSDDTIDFLTEELEKRLYKRVDSSERTLSNFTNYYDQLTPIEKQFYDVVYNGSKKTPPQFEFSYIYDDSKEKISADEFRSKIYLLYIKLITVLNFDNPDLWWIKTYSGAYFYNDKDFKHEVSINTNPTNSLFYNYTAENVVSISKKIEIMKKDIINKIDALNLTTNYAKLLYIHHYLITKTTYMNDTSRKHIRTIYGSLVENTCVCSGYAKAFKYIAKHYNIESAVVLSLYHEWNYVKMGNKWYIVDITWDYPVYLPDKLSGYGYDKANEISTNYFLKGSTHLKNNDQEDFHKVVYSSFYGFDAIYYPQISSKDYEPNSKEKSEVEKVIKSFSSSYTSTTNVLPSCVANSSNKMDCSTASTYCINGDNRIYNLSCSLKYSEKSNKNVIFLKGSTGYNIYNSEKVNSLSEFMIYECNNVTDVYSGCITISENVYIDLKNLHVYKYNKTTNQFYQLQNGEYYDAETENKYSCDSTGLCKVSKVSRCGDAYGSCPSGQCCSKKGYCGTTSSYCSLAQGCQSSYGKCAVGRCGAVWGSCPSGQCCSKKGYCGTTSSYCSLAQGCQSSYGKCAVGRCGAVWGSCPSGQCCSKKGYCGTTSSYCSLAQGCQSSYGKCAVGRCGAIWGSCPSGQCCSKKGYCGTTSSYCSLALGCQSIYGKCS